MKPIIFCVVGKTGAGKDTITDILISKISYLQRLVYSTTRERRENEIDGVHYNFKTESDFINIRSAGNIVEDRAYDTGNGKVRYFTTKDELELVESNKAFIVSASADQVMSYIAAGYEVYLIDIECDAKYRLKRILKRNCKTDKDVLEACRRIINEEDEYNKINRLNEDKDYGSKLIYKFDNNVEKFFNESLNPLEKIVTINEKNFINSSIEGACQFIRYKVVSRNN